MEKWEEIINKFNFDKVHAYMLLNNRRWLIENGEFEMPTIQQLKDTAIYLIGLAEGSMWRNSKRYYSSSIGGFKASYSPYNKKIILEFILTSATENIK